MSNDISVVCSRSKCKRPAVVCRWYVKIDPYPVLVAYLCSDCKDVFPWNEDIIKEVTMLQPSAKELK